MNMMQLFFWGEARRFLDEAYFIFLIRWKQMLVFNQALPTFFSVLKEAHQICLNSVTH